MYVINGPIDTAYVNGPYKDSVYELISCPGNKPGCLVAHYRKRIDPEQLRRAEMIDNEISGIFE